MVKKTTSLSGNSAASPAAHDETDPGGWGRIDLHSHSTASDGVMLPRALVKAAVQAGLKALALTDHDTIEGLDEFYKAGREYELKTIGGVEISLEHPGTMHLLGLNVSERNTTPSALNMLKTFRIERNLKMQDTLGHLGYYLPWDKLLKISGGGQMGRPHFATLLMEKGYFKTREEVFDKLLGKGKSGYVDKKRLSPQEGLAMLNEAGWAPVLAHPISLGLRREQWPAYLKKLVAWGLAGLEVYHPSHNLEQITFFRALTADFSLAATAGSDFHGENKPTAGLNWVLNHSPLGWEMMTQLRKKCASQQTASKTRATLKRGA